MVAALVLASCGQAEEEEKEAVPPLVGEEEVVRPQSEEEEIKQPEEEGPSYGGLFRQCWSRRPLFFDEAFGHQYYATTMYQTNETLLQGDWAKGPAGTGEASWLLLVMPPPNLMTGCLAESWEVVEPDTITYKIRHGVHFHDKPPTNGRELTADDVVFTLKYVWGSSRSYHAGAYSWETHLQSIEAPDKWTVVVKAIPGMLGKIYEHVSMSSFMLPRDAIEEYGDLADWENSCGTGPFMLVDYVTESSATFVRNPNYWAIDPVHPENQLPYLDGVKYLIITDSSTRLAALRTGKIDWIGEIGAIIGWEDAESLMETNPELNYVGYPGSTGAAIYMRVDDPELPWYDITVRHALSLAIDNQEIADTLYGGYAELLGWPVHPMREYKDMYTPLEQLPESTRELFEYHPDKAKQLLAEAGYPNGFKCEVLTIAGGTDLMSVVKDYWAQIGIDLEIDVKEYGAFVGMGSKRTYTQMLFGGTHPVLCFRFLNLYPDQEWNYSMVDDPLINEAYHAIQDVYFDEAKRRQLMKDITPHILEQCYLIPLPAHKQYHFWQPWVQGYHGELLCGYMGSFEDFTKYIWIDQDLKEEMTGRR